MRPWYAVISCACARGFGHAQGLRLRRNALARHYDELGMGAIAGEADVSTAAPDFSAILKHPGKIAAGRTRQGGSFHASQNVLGIARIDGSGGDLYQHLAGAWNRTVDLADLQYIFERSEAFEAQRLHEWLSGSQTGRKSSVKPATGPSPSMDCASGRSSGAGAGAIDLNRTPIRIDQPRELRSVVDPFAHFRAQHGQAVGMRAQFDDKIRAKMPEAFQGRGIELADACLQSPCGVRRAPGSTGQNEAPGGAAHDTAAVALRPVRQLEIDLSVANSGQREVRRHDDQFAFRSHLKEEIRVLGAELGERVVGHRADGQCGRKPSLVDD